MYCFVNLLMPLFQCKYSAKCPNNQLLMVMQKSVNGRARMEGVKNPHGVRGMIIRVSDQLRCGEISLFEKAPEEVDAAKAKLEAKRAQRRERYAKSKEKVNAKWRAAYVSKKYA